MNELTVSEGAAGGDDGLAEVLTPGQFARPRFSRPVNLSRVNRQGHVFEIEKDEEDWDLYEDEGEEVYDEETYALFETYTPSDVRVQVMDGDDRIQIRSQLDIDKDMAFAFADFEPQMVNVNEDGSVKKMVIKAGNGFNVPERCRIYYHYSAIGEGGREVFDSSLSRKYPGCTDLRCPESVLPGIYTALRSMEMNEMARFIIEPIMAFGALGCEPRIPPNARILFVIETLQYIGEERLNTPLFMSQVERNALPFDVIYETSHQLRLDGNGLYKNDNIQIAIKNWRRAVTILEDYPATDGEMCSRRTQMLQALYSNLAQGYLRLNKPAQACNACKLGLKLVDDKDSCKLLFRFAKAKLMLKDVDCAVSLVERGLQYDHKNVELLGLKEEILKEHLAQYNKEKSLWQRALKQQQSKEETKSVKAERSASLTTLAGEVENGDTDEFVSSLDNDDSSSEGPTADRTRQKAVTFDNRPRRPLTACSAKNTNNATETLPNRPSTARPSGDPLDLDDLVNPFVYCSTEEREEDDIPEVPLSRSRAMTDLLGPPTFYDFDALDSDEVEVVDSVEDNSSFMASNSPLQTDASTTYPEVERQSQKSTAEENGDIETNNGEKANDGDKLDPINFNTNPE